MYPIMLDLNEKAVLVVGGGRIAARKVEGLLGQGAFITVIAPEIDPWIIDTGVNCILKPVEQHDISNFDMIFIATNDRDANVKVRKSILSEQLLNDCTDQIHSNFFNVAVFDYDGMRVMVSSEGESPARSKALKEELERYLNGKDNN